MTLLLLALAALVPGAVRAAPPSIVLIVADDLGYSDLGSYGGEIETPEIDRLAFEGVRFSRFYATPRCSPSRAAILTGVWSHEAGVAHLAHDWGADAYRGAIHRWVPTLAERLGAAGYATHMVGKWHLTPELPPAGGSGGDEATAGGGARSDPPASWPLQRGFDTFYGTLGGSGSYFDPPFLYDGNAPAAWPPPGAGATPYLTDVLGERAAATVTAATAAERPWFLYLAFTAPHWPLHAPAGDAARYRGRYDQGWDTLRSARFRRQQELGLTPATAELPPRDPTVPSWSELTDPQWQARRMEIYAAMVSALDRAVGKVTAALEAAGALDHTVVLFLSDNGACAERFEGLERLARYLVTVPERTADGREVRFGDDPSIEPGPADTFATYGRGWAHLSNTPLRRYKHSTHEGGISVPFFVHWPARLRDRAGAIVAAPAHVVDLVPTLLELAGVEAATAAVDAAAPSGASSDRSGGPGSQGPADRGEREPPPLRGRSLLPELAGGAGPERLLLWEHEGNRAVSRGRWKLVERWPFGWELYDLEADRSELHDSAGREPELVAELGRVWTEWALAVGVEPWPLVVPAVRTAALIAAALLLLGGALLRLRGRSSRTARPHPAPAPEPGPPATATLPTTPDPSRPSRRWEPPPPWEDAPPDLGSELDQAPETSASAGPRAAERSRPQPYVSESPPPPIRPR